MTGPPSTMTGESGTGTNAGHGGVNHFADAHGGERPYLLRVINKHLSNGQEHAEKHIHSHHAPVHARHLFKRPVVRQWVYGGRLFREKASREAAKTELFFDLVFVGIIHQLADGASESATGINIAKFILIFYPSWSIWSDVRNYINTSGTDDVVMRIYMFIIMCLLLGYSANVSAIKIEKAGEAATAAAAGAVTEIVKLAGRSLLGRQEATTSSSGESAPVASSGGPSETGTVGETPAESQHTFAGGYTFGEGFASALSAAAAYFLVARLIRILIYLTYGYSLPRFRQAHFLQAACLAIISCIYLPLIWVANPTVVVTLASLGIFAELSSRYFVGLYIRLTHRRVAKKGQTGWYVPALNIEHSMERTGLFVILVIGESIINVTFAPLAGSSQYGPHSEYWRALMGLSISFSLCWIYFDADSSRVFIHALRRHWFTSISYTHIHWPLCASLILMSAGLARMVANDHFENSGYRWMFSGALGSAVFCLAIIGYLHKNLDKIGSARIPRPVRLAARLATSVIIVCLPLADALDDTLKTLAICACILVGLVAFEMFGKLGSIGAGWEDMHDEDSEEEDEREQNLGELQASPNFNAESVSESHMQEDTTANTSADGPSNDPEKQGGEEVQQIRDATGERNGHLAIMVSPPEEPRARMPSTTSTSRRIALEAMRTARRKEKAARWAKELHALTENERGEDDVGMEEDLGNIEVREINSNQQWAYSA
ncbi:hypothetical protein FRB94_001407 [Tulasnella sp. JGI-2019a]|nr:hypothetical protein FRB93_013507 [Tulasnella sp. JGI-2019a]KAG9005623.1 hypothetical protein FRB94_001407 [Tulasnella sp. JGI-2019a]KAG9034462.1 hypothetical protein FRB95_013138 [Tulasnella sp. JGI-2019a]